MKVRNSSSLSTQVRSIVADMDKRGFDAIINYSQKFDKFNLSKTNILISTAEIEKQSTKLTSNQRRAIDFAYAQVQLFQEQIARSIEKISTKSEFGVTNYVPKPMNRIGIYVPGGLAPLPSSLLMAGISAKTAGVENLIVCTPPRSEGLNPAIAYLLLKLGVSDAFWLGGVAAIWFMANGMTDISTPVDKICGPGNSYVAEAKSQFAQSGKIAIDMIAGPSEVLIIADESANPVFIAADLIAQAEHGINSSAILVTDSSELAASVQTKVDCQLENMKRKNEIKKALKNCGGIFIAQDLLEEGISITNQFAPEHLEIFCKKDLESQFLTKNLCAGAIFVRTGEAFADYGMTGGNHILPTNGTSRFSSGLSVRDFFVWQYVEELSEAGQCKFADMAACFADLESLEGHANAARVRSKEVEK
ncbi:MAG: histidinol dehydrogenase [Candidatus Micrarchaeota archaeon]